MHSINHNHQEVMEGGIEEDNHKSKSPTAKPQVIKVEEEVGEAIPTMGL